MTLLEVDDIVSGYGDAIIVDGAHLDVEAGEMVTVIGPNGAGKSTFLKTIVGLLRIRDGSVRFDGEDITGVPAEDAIDYGICYVPQTENVFPNLTVRENLKMGAWTLDDGLFEDRTQRVFERFPELEGRMDALAGNLSGGQQQMVAVGAALMLDPELLILDEPSAGLAPDLVEDMFEKVEEINDTGTTILMVEQNARRALESSDRGIVLDMGETHMQGTGSELLNSEEIAELYLGT
ncbi:ABC transporter ATP-binding protein [Haloarculaceae archaeon H-GB2-1]|nr:ABC transporter ATP-binding protein [Haloarculaceae archaeon H-GB1-1]MEA5387161.1 ABC transporter ATP-binding protein [Haloarculaceae archaeon H-GB11]MEA5408653.1 ABC transporter ATP-binding protein [Haloarculaceae archaeon H-GB2-1]